MKKTVIALPKLTAIAVLAAIAAPAIAQQAGDTVVNLGWFHLAPQESSETLKIGGHEVPGSSAKVSNADTLGLQINHFLTDNWVITGDIGIPPRFKLDGAGSLSGIHVGGAKQWSPALLGKYYFFDAKSSFRPFLGAGVTYVWYTDVRLSDQFQHTLSDQITTGQGLPAGLGLRTNADLSNSFTPLISVGGTYNIDQKWSVGLSLSYIFLKTKADLTTTLPTGVAVHSNTKLTLDPLVSFLSVGYKF